MNGNDKMQTVRLSKSGLICDTPSLLYITTEMIRLEASGVVYDKACLVFSLCGVGIANATNQITIYDGFGTNDKKIMTLVGAAYESDFRRFDSPLFFAKGIYADFTTNADEFFAQVFDPNR